MLKKNGQHRINCSGYYPLPLLLQRNGVLWFRGSGL